MSKTPSWSHHVALASEEASAGRARDFVAGHLIDHALFYLVEDVRLVASELATNAVLHAGRPFSVTLRGDDSSVLLTVRDGSTLQPVHARAQVIDLHGRGLSIVDNISDQWGVSHIAGGNKSVWASFKLRQGDRLPATP